MVIKLLPKASMGQTSEISKIQVRPKPINFPPKSKCFFFFLLKRKKTIHMYTCIHNYIYITIQHVYMLEWGGAHALPRDENSLHEERARWHPTLLCP